MPRGKAIRARPALARGLPSLWEGAHLVCRMAASYVAPLRRSATSFCQAGRKRRVKADGPSAARPLAAASAPGRGPPAAGAGGPPRWQPRAEARGRSRCPCRELVERVTPGREARRCTGLERRCGAPVSGSFVGVVLVVAPRDDDEPRASGSFDNHHEWARIASMRRDMERRPLAYMYPIEPRCPCTACRQRIIRVHAGSQQSFATGSNDPLS